MQSDNNEKRLAFEEFQLFYESTERVTERRLSGNRWNYSICSAVIVAVAALLQWAIAHLNFFVVGAGAAIVLSVTGMLFCSLWIGQIRDFKKLNDAKFDVLNSMAPQVAFGAPKEDDRVSCSPFDKEWETLKEKEAVQEMGSINIVALKSSNIEYLLPKAFRVIFVLLVLSIGAGIVSNLGVFVDSLSLNVTTRP